MDDLDAELDGLAVDVTSPDRGISIMVRGEQVEVRVRPGAYRRYDEPTLAHQLGQLAKVAWTRWRAAYDKVIERHIDGMVDDDLDAEAKQYRASLRRLTADGVSEDGSIELRTRGFLDWEVTIAPRTVRQVTEDAFVSRLLSAFSDLRVDHRRKVVVLQDEVYGFGWTTALMGHRVQIN